MIVHDPLATLILLFVLLLVVSVMHKQGENGFDEELHMTSQEKSLSCEARELLLDLRGRMNPREYEELVAKVTKGDRELLQNGH